MDTSIGTVDFQWGIHRWVMLRAPRGVSQRQISSRRELSAFLVDVGLTQDEAAALADRLWNDRPREADPAAPRRNEAAWRGTGLPAWAVGVVLLAVICAFVLFRLFAH